MALSSSDYMTVALKLAKKGQFSVSPNPMVGCVIVKDDQIIGQGFHVKAGDKHAEIAALLEAGDKAQGATAYVTLEPCCHHGKTPPCTDALIKAGIKKVYFACLDPNPLVAGQGKAALEAAGIEVIEGPCTDEALQLNEAFCHYITTKRPFVIAKWAMSLDGKTITHPDDSPDISSPASRTMTHQTRRAVDAILVGSKTAIQDNPSLTVRLPHDDESKQPLRIILASKGNLPLDLKLFEPHAFAKTLVVITSAADPAWTAAALQLGIEILTVRQNENQQIDLIHLLEELGKRQITSLLVEGGMHVHESFFKENLVNKVEVYLAPVIIGSLPKKQLVEVIEMKSIDRDYYLSAHYKRS